MVFLSTTKHPRHQYTLEDLFLRVFVLVDDRLIANAQRFALPPQSSQVAGYSALFTVAWVGELPAQPSGPVWYRPVFHNHRDLCPALPDYTRYHRVVRNAERLWAELAIELAAHAPSWLEIIDTRPLPLAKGRRARWARMPEATKGFSTLGMVWGFKLPAVVSRGGPGPCPRA